ncbi:MAG TPA: condensation domain-containing protein, partial [Longimicrobium sp.]|nr:condensation domain-containing protein [Longimicrobium sp.]
PVPAEEMREWVEATVARIRSLAPRRVLEIGCGTGLLLSRVAPHCERYVATDFSPRAVKNVQALRGVRPELAHVEALERRADDFGGLEAGSFDTVVINSVAQYLPSLEYLARVLEGAVRLLEPGGRVFVGDVRDLRLLGAFRTAVETFRSAPGRPVAEWRDRAEQAQAQEEELVIDPAFFWTLGQELEAVARVETLHKRGAFRNELTEFRYDAVLHVGEADDAGCARCATCGGDPGCAALAEELGEAVAGWEVERLTLASLAARLQGAEGGLRVEGIPNARVGGALRQLELRRDPRGVETVDDVRRRAAAEGVDPEELWRLAESLGWRVEVRLADSGDAGRMDARFTRAAEGEARRPFPARTARPRLEPSAYATDPLRGRRTGVLVRRLRDHLGERLPEYMVPASYVALDAFPRTPNGKTDRKALPAPEGDAVARRAYEAPASETESVLAEIWSELLGVEGIGRRDNFFELGGHSLLAVRLVERMGRRGLHAEVGALFTAPTLAELAAAVGGASPGVAVPPNGIPTPCDAVTPEMLPLVQLTQGEIDAVAAGVPGGAANVQDVYPLAPLQEGILFHHLATAEGDPYLFPAHYAFDSRERLDAWVAALQAVVDRHDILRTSLAWEGLPEPVQVVWRRARLEVEELEVDASVGDVAAHLSARFDPRRARIDVRRAPLMRAHAARDGDRWLLVLLVHHLASDNTAVRVLADEVAAHLLGRAADLPAPLPFRDYVAQTRLAVAREAHEAYFRALLGDVDEPTAPFGLLGLPADARMADATLQVDPRLAARLRERARRLGVTAASLVHLAWAQVLARVSGRGDVVFGTVLFGRMQGGEGADRVMGPFINSLPLRVRIGAEGVEESVLGVHRQLAGLLRHEHASLALAQRCSGVAAPAPLFTALLNYRQRRDAGADRVRALEGVQPLRGEGQGRSNYPLTLSVDDLERGMSLKVFAPESVGPAGVCAMVHRALEGVAEALEAAPRRPVGEVDVLPEAVRRRVVEGWNAAEPEPAGGAFVHQLF